MKLSHTYYLFVGLVLLSLVGCQESFIPDNYSEESEYVIEGFVEAGEGSSQVYVLITRTVPFLSEIGQDVFSELFVTGADVEVDDGDKVTKLTQLCLSDLPPEFQEEFVSQLGLVGDSLDFDYCLYIDLLDQIDREFGRSYDLRINIEGDELTATTTIPQNVELDSVWFTEIPGDPIDSLAQIWAKISDPAGVNYYRYFTDDGSGRLTTSAFGSVIDDVFFDGQQFDFPLTKASQRGAEMDPATFGFFATGDTTTLKWCSIDAAHYDFWNTYEFNLNNQGPFASYTRVNHNIQGGLGIWGGLAVNVYELEVVK